MNIDGSTVVAEVKEGEEPADYIFNILQPYGVSYLDRQRIMEEMKKDGVLFARDHALVFTQDIKLSDNSSAIGTLAFVSF